jgi:hypothetical protein
LQVPQKSAPNPDGKSAKSNTKNFNSILFQFDKYKEFFIQLAKEGKKNLKLDGLIIVYLLYSENAADN